MSGWMDHTDRMEKKIVCQRNAVKQYLCGPLLLLGPHVRKTGVPNRWSARVDIWGDFAEQIYFNAFGVTDLAPFVRLGTEIGEKTVIRTSVTTSL